MSYKKILFISLLFLIYSYKSTAQRYYFEQYDIERGLIQSQVTAIVQDQKRKLWIATLGGLGSFNGRQFTNYSRTNGLTSNYNVALAVDKSNKIWIGSSGALTSYDGQRFIKRSASSYWTRKLASTKNGEIFTLRKRSLYKIEKDQEQYINISKDSMEYVSSIYADPMGRLWAAVYNKGIYFLENNTWKSLHFKNGLPPDLEISDILLDNHNRNRLWLVSTKGVYVAENGLLSKEPWAIDSKPMCIAQDDNGAVWVGAEKGAYLIKKRRIIHFTAQNGFTDNTVSKIFKDIENNIWLGTYGAGLFKFNNNNYVIFDESQGIHNKLVMAVSYGPSSDAIWMGAYDGLYEYRSGQKIRNIEIPFAKDESYHINFLHRDSKKRVWIGSAEGGLWLATDKAVKRVDQKSPSPISYQSIIETGNKEIWITTNRGVFTFDEGTKKLNKISKLPGNSLLDLGRDTVLVGTQDGAYVFVNKQNVRHIKNKNLMGSSILCMLKYKGYILFGTSDYGLLIWNRETGKNWTINTKNGLASDHIYSIIEDSNGLIWLGTGRGISRMDPKNFKLINTPDANGLLVECNQNAILQDHNNMWIGTTKGVIVYKVDPMPSVEVKPYITINSINVFPSYKRKTEQSTFKTTFKSHELQERPSFPYSHNYISINFSGIYLTNPSSLRYKYRLVGLDNKFSQASSNSAVNFTAVPAGRYTFEVIAITKEGLTSVNTASFSFEILPPYYQTNTFRFFVFLLVILLILATVYAILTINERRRKLHLKIKLEEQYKIRKQTAEDFHDDLGNKLTRITVLSEVLSSMLRDDDSEKKNIIKKIATNVNELYNGTKDILWSLNPKNDTLNQLVDHIKDFGIEMFNDTPAQFKHHIEIPDNHIGLTLDLNRNVLLIFKESIHNALKHSKATEVYFKAKLNNKLLLLSLEDNGKGFDINKAKSGHGMNNMYLRAERIGADLNVISKADGTAICLLINFSTLKRKQNV